MSQYPIIKIPQSIKNAQSAEPPEPPAPVRPQEPGVPPRRIYYTLTLIETVFAVIIAFIISQAASIPSWFTLMLAMGVITSHVWYQATTYPERKGKHNEEVANYPKKLKDYQGELIKHSEEVKALKSPERLAEFRYKLLLETLGNTIPHDGDGGNAQENPRERIFRNQLKQYFSNKIYTKLTLSIPDFPHPYVPDFAYIDQEVNLYIDIELDEPYVYHTGQPNHYLGYWKDEKRNSFFLRKGWIVIRFSEEQIAKYPKSCIKAIATVISEITNDTSILTPFKNIPDLQPVKHWTEAEAIEMYSQRFRDTY